MNCIERLIFFQKIMFTEHSTSPKVSNESVNTKVETWLLSTAPQINKKSTQPINIQVIEQCNSQLPCIMVETSMDDTQSSNSKEQESLKISNEKKSDDSIPIQIDTGYLHVHSRIETKVSRTNIQNIAQMKSWVRHWKTQVHLNEHSSSTKNETISEVLSTVISSEKRLDIVQAALPIVNNIAKLYRWQLGRNDRLTKLAENQIQHIHALEKNLSNSNG